MQKFAFAPARIRDDVIYQGVTFTVVRLIYDNEDGHETIAEGISRRSGIDMMDHELGRSIAYGRALKALKKKLLREPIRNHFMG